MLTAGTNSPLLLLVWIPLCYGVGHLADDAYIMPYVYDISEAIGNLLQKVSHIGKRSKELHNTEKKVSVKIGQNS